MEQFTLETSYLKAHSMQKLSMTSFKGGVKWGGMGCCNINNDLYSLNFLKIGTVVFTCLCKK